MVQLVAIAIPTLKIGIEQASNPQQVSVFLQILFLLTVLSIAPALLLMLTSFTRLIVVFSILRHALGLQATPQTRF
jgi:flagellar biosynthetic protein FliP